MRIYLAASLFNEREILYNLRVADVIEESGHMVILPQTFAGNEYDLYKQCIAGIDACDIVVAVLDGQDVDSGVGFECGYAQAIGKPIVGIRSDTRTDVPGGLNLMLRYGVTLLINSVDMLGDTLNDLSTDISSANEIPL